MLRHSWDGEKLAHSIKVKELEDNLKIQERRAAEERVERTCAVRDLTEELDMLKADFEKLNAAHKRLKANEREVRDDYQALTAEFDALKEEMRSMEDDFTSQISALKQIIFQKEQQASSWEEKFSQKCEELNGFQAEIEENRDRVNTLTKAVNNLTDEKKQLEQDVSDLEHDFGVLSRMLDTEKAERRKDVKQLHQTVRDQQERLGEQEERISALEEAASQAGSRVDALDSATQQLGEQRDAMAATLARLRAEVTVWLLDAICLRFDKPVDFDFDGSSPIEESDAEHIHYTEHKDLYYLIRILALDGFEYRGSAARIEVSGLTFLAGLNKSTPRPVSAPMQDGGDFGEANSERTATDKEPDSSGVPSARSSSAGTLRGANETMRLGGNDTAGFLPDHTSGHAGNRPASGHEGHRPSTGGRPPDDYERLREAHAGCEERLREWRAKCISLAQRLEKAEGDLGMPRPADVEKIRQLEGQVKALVWALKETTVSKEGAVQSGGHLPALRRTSRIP